MLITPCFLLHGYLGELFCGVSKGHCAVFSKYIILSPAKRGKVGRRAEMGMFIAQERYRIDKINRKKNTLLRQTGCMRRIILYTSRGYEMDARILNEVTIC